MRLHVYVEMFEGILLLIFTLIFHEVISPEVIDSLDHEGIIYSDYCPKTEHCQEGAHVMCMYYDPKRKYGLRCHNPRNVTVTEEIVLTILEVTNAVRSKAAQGLHTGKNDAPLPRAYGMNRLNWDSELATFAQISVDRCHLKHDLCRATKRFPNPAQVGSLVRFLYPSWNYVPNNVNLAKYLNQDVEDLTHDKVMHAVNRTLKNFFSTQQLVVPDMITNYPDYEKNPELVNAAAYLNMVHAASTHVGCALSGYTEFLLPQKHKKQNQYYNVVAMMCNFSAQPLSGSQVYNTSRPKKPRHSIRCGCPPGTVEDEDCLCNEKANATHESMKCRAKNCKPPLLILPIFQIEDAPPSMLSRRSSKSKTELQFPNKSNYKEIWEPHVTRKSSRKKPSIFSRSSIFELPVNKGSKHFNAIIKNLVQTVMPRKNFTYAKNLLNSYMDKSRKTYKSHAKTLEENPIKYEITTEIFLNKTDEKTTNKSYDKKNSTNYNEINSDETGDEKLLDLLDNLEHEIGHIELHGDKIELIDAKIREIQDTIIGNPAGILEPDRPETGISQSYVEEPVSVYKNGSPFEQEQVYINKHGSSLENKAGERHKYSIIDIYNKKTENDHEHDFRPVSVDKISYGPLNRRKNQHYTELRKRNKNAEHRIPYERKNKQLYDEKHDEYEPKVWNNKYNAEGHFKHKHDREKDKIGFYAHEMLQDNDEDLLSSDRKTYYHNKLENLEKRIQNSNARHQKEITERHIRPIKRPHTSNEVARRPSKSPQNPLYIQDRARVVHGF